MPNIGNSIKKRFVCVLLVVVLFISISPIRLEALSERKVKMFNILGTSVFTLLRGIIDGKVKNFKDVASCLVFGAASGYGFYKSKSLIAKGKVWEGILIANLSTSIAENVARGENPLSYLGYSFGPIRLNLATPFAKSPPALINVDYSPAQTLAFIYSFVRTPRIKFRDGLIVFEKYRENKNSYATGLFPTISYPTAYGHEVVHVVQNLQIMAVSPEPELEYSEEENSRKFKLLKFRGVRYESYMYINFVYHYLTPYEKRWYEKEAYHFAEK